MLKDILSARYKIDGEDKRPSPYHYPSADIPIIISRNLPSMGQWTDAHRCCFRRRVVSPSDLLTGNVGRNKEQ